MVNPEERKNAPGEQPGDLGRLLSDCSFVVFRPDQGVASVEAALQEETLAEGYMMREFRVEGQLVTIMADLPDSEHGYLMEISVTGKPERGIKEDWFVRQTTYRISKSLEITQSVEEKYDLVDLDLLPEYYPEIAEEADEQHRRRYLERQMLRLTDPLANLRLIFNPPDVQNEQLRKELGLDQVGAKEIADLAVLIAKIRTDPDMHALVRRPKQ